MSAEQVDAVGQGRVWDGGTARQIKLVDQFGGLSDALSWVATQAKLEDGGWHPRFLEEPIDGRDALIAQLLGSGNARMNAGTGGASQPGGDLFAIAAQNRDRALARLLADAERLSGRAGVQAYCLACPALPAQPLDSATSRQTLSTWQALQAFMSSQ